MFIKIKTFTSVNLVCVSSKRKHARIQWAISQLFSQSTHRIKQLKKSLQLFKKIQNVAWAGINMYNILCKNKLFLFCCSVTESTEVMLLQIRTVLSCFGTVEVPASKRRSAGWSMTAGWKPADCTAKLQLLIPDLFYWVLSHLVTEGDQPRKHIHIENAVKFAYDCKVTLQDINLTHQAKDYIPKLFVHKYAAKHRI